MPRSVWTRFKLDSYGLLESEKSVAVPSPLSVIYGSGCHSNWEYSWHQSSSIYDKLPALILQRNLFIAEKENFVQ